MSFIIYKIESPTGRIYIGQTRNFKKRMREYKGLRCEKQSILYRSLLKYSFNKHKITILKEFSTITKHHLDDIEIYYIDYYRKLGYNMLNIADGGQGGLVSEATREKLRQAQLGRKYSKESRLKMSEAHKGKPSPNKGKKVPRASVEKMIKNRIGKCTGASHWRTKPLINIETNDIYQSITEAAKAISMKRSTLNAMLSEQSPNKSYVRYL